MHIITRIPPPTPPTPLEDRNLDNLQTFEELLEVAKRLKYVLETESRVKREREENGMNRHAGGRAKDCSDEVEHVDTRPAKRQRILPGEDDEVIALYD